jgi:hypothetical protein
MNPRTLSVLHLPTGVGTLLHGEAVLAGELLHKYSRIRKLSIELSGRWS